MASPTHDDSLVFAEDTRWGAKHSEELPNTHNSNFSPISDKTFEPTQIDQSTSPIFPERSYFSSEEHDFSLSAVPTRLKHGSGTEETQELVSLANSPSQNTKANHDNEHDGNPEAEGGDRMEIQLDGEIEQDKVELDKYDDTQVIQAKPVSEISPIIYNPLNINDTQVVGRGNGPKTENISRKDELEATTLHNIEDTRLNGRDANDLVLGNLETQRIGSKGVEADTQVITQKEIDAGTQVIHHENVVANVICHEDINDTQVIHTRDNMASSPRNHDMIANDTLIIPRSSLEDTSALWKHTQPITQLPDLRPDAITQVGSSPNKTSEFELDSTLLMSPARALDEPTTQVLNTQEELFELSGSVDLGHKPVYSSWQNDEKLQSQLSIISNEDDIRLEENNMLYEDSVFRHKRKRRRMELETYMDEDESAHVSRSPRPEIHDAIEMEDKANITHKMAWSQSSSELEDVSHDVQDLDLNAFANMEDYDDSIDRIIVPTKRRRNEIPATQSQKSQSQNQNRMEIAIENQESQTENQAGNITEDQKEIQTENQTENNNTQAIMVQQHEPIVKKTELRQECLDTLDVQTIQNPKAVWAFAQFKHYPARVLEAGETTSLIEFADLAQLEVKNTDLYLMDLRIGDDVHLILNMGEYIVTGLAELYPESDFQCIRGYDTVFVARKGRQMQKELQVPVSSVFMEVGKWASHQQKFHIFHEHIDLVQENFGVVKNLIGSFNEIQDFPISATISPKKLADTNGRSLRSNIFEGMVFFVTSIEGERKDQLAEMIINNGGVFIDDEIKHYTTMERTSDGQLRLSLTKFDGFHFGALLSDGYSRSPKYLQALALGWPILAECFIEQAINNAEMLDNWHVYLLPAGHSLITNGIKSLEVFDFRMNCAKEVPMNGQFANNMHLLASYNLVILNKKQDARTLDMCGFIFHAFGAHSLQQCLNVLEINNVLSNRDINNILVYDNAVGEFASSHTRKTMRRTLKLKQTTIGIIDWEWVVQSVISGYVWKPKTRISL